MIKPQLFFAFSRNAFPEGFIFFPAAAEDFPVLSPVIPSHKIIIPCFHNNQAMINRPVLFLRIRFIDINHLKKLIPFPVSNDHLCFPRKSGFVI